MDTATALGIAHNYVQLAKASGYTVLEAFLFGSAAKGLAEQDSDIDIALVLEGDDNSFDIQIELMILRRQIDTRIEPHPFMGFEQAHADPFFRSIQSTGVRVA